MIKSAAQLKPGDIFECHGGSAVVLHVVDLGTHLDVYSAMLGRPPLPVCEPPAQVAFDARYTVADNLVETFNVMRALIDTVLTGGDAREAAQDSQRLIERARRAGVF